MPPPTVTKAGVLWLAAVAATVAFAGDRISARVVGVADGDTLTVLDEAKQQHRVRIAGIDAPERGQPYSERSKETLSRLAFDRQVAVAGQKRDRFGRLVAQVDVDGVDVGLAQLRAGMAWHFKAYEGEQRAVEREAYATAEREARFARRGLWADVQPEPPWDWRRRQRAGNRPRQKKRRPSAPWKLRIRIIDFVEIPPHLSRTANAGSSARPMFLGGHSGKRATAPGRRSARRRMDRNPKPACMINRRASRSASGELDVR